MSVDADFLYWRNSIMWKIQINQSLLQSNTNFFFENYEDLLRITLHNQPETYYSFNSTKQFQWDLAKSAVYNKIGKASENLTEVSQTVRITACNNYSQW